MSSDPYVIAQQAQLAAIKKFNAKQRPTIKKTPHKRQLNLRQGSDQQQEGSKNEDLACLHIQEQGLTILAQNLRCKLGEIDIVAVDGNSLVFIEVRKRQNNRYGGAAASIVMKKRLKLIRTANYFLPILYRRIGRQLPCRFDVIAFEASQINWIKHAFSA